jgi:hypothetical protein
MTTPTLLIVGGLDTPVIQMNRDAMKQMRGRGHPRDRAGCRALVRGARDARTCGLIRPLSAARLSAYRGKPLPTPHHLIVAGTLTVVHVRIIGPASCNGLGSQRTCRLSGIEGSHA